MIFVRRYWQWLLGGLIAATFIYFGVFVFSVISWLAAEKQSAQDPKVAISKTLRWSGLSPFPASTKNLQIETEGGIFTRGFHVSFQAPPEDIKRWWQQSLRTNGSIPAIIESDRRYELTPHGGANSASLTVNLKSGLVKIYVSWS
jgi:hypothetical protein